MVAILFALLKRRELRGKMAFEKKPNVLELDSLIQSGSSQYMSSTNVSKDSKKPQKKDEDVFSDDLKKMDSVSEEQRCAQTYHR